MVVSQWKERLEHVRLLARMIVLEGNVSDMFIQENGLEAGRLVELDQYLYQYLVDAGYHAVVFFNRIDSFYNLYDRTGEMLKLFYKEAEIVNDNEKPDLMQAMSAIRVAMKNEEHSIAVVIDMAGQLMSSPEHLGDQEIEYLTTLFLAAKEAAEAPISSVQGWASTITSIWAIGGLQLLAIGIIGEYIGKIYLETKARPKFIIETNLEETDKE